MMIPHVVALHRKTSYPCLIDFSCFATFQCFRNKCSGIMFVNSRVLLEYNDLCQPTLVKLSNSCFALLSTINYLLHGTSLFKLWNIGALECTGYVALLLEIVQQQCFFVSMTPCIYSHGIHLFYGTLSVVIALRTFICICCWSAHNVIMISV
jgi:hypothetical protein